MYLIWSAQTGQVVASHTDSATADKIAASRPEYYVLPATVNPTHVNY